MSTDDQKTPSSAAHEALVLRLYVAGDSPNSRLAVENLDAICRQHLNGSHTLEVIDVLEQPLRAVADGILVTPVLVKVSPAPGRKILGDLSETRRVLFALGLGSVPE